MFLLDDDAYKAYYDADYEITTVEVYGKKPMKKTNRAPKTAWEAMDGHEERVIDARENKNDVAFFWKHANAFLRQSYD